MEVRGYVLAGGRSRRFGRDKSQILIDDRRAVERQVDLVAAVCSGQVSVIGDGRRLAANDENRLAANAVQVIADRHGNQGPLDGVLTALQDAADTTLALVVAVDLWSLTPAVLRRLLDVFDSPDSGTDVAFLRSDLDEQPLAAVWRVRESMTALQAAFDAGERSILRAWVALRRTPVTVARDVLANINTADDFELWQSSRAAPEGAAVPPESSS